jgi:hypothetical protein
VDIIENQKRGKKMTSFDSLTKAELRCKLRAYFGPRNYRISSEGAVYGHESGQGWYYLGRLEFVENEITRERGSVWRVR